MRAGGAGRGASAPLPQPEEQRLFHTIFTTAFSTRAYLYTWEEPACTCLPTHWQMFCPFGGFTSAHGVGTKQGTGGTEAEERGDGGHTA